MARDYAKKKTTPRRKAPPRKRAPAKQANAPARSGSGLRWYIAGLLTGVFLSFLLYLGTLPPAGGPQVAQQPASTEEEQAPPKPRFDFYTMLPEQTIDEDMPAPDRAAPTQASNPGPAEYYFLQAGSFRQREDADRRRAELLLLGLEPSIRESTGDNGRWFRVFLGPFETRSNMSRARSLTAAQNIDTLVLKRSG
jgi:cell division protein FtsN